MEKKTPFPKTPTSTNIHQMTKKSIAIFSIQKSISFIKHQQDSRTLSSYEQAPCTIEVLVLGLLILTDAAVEG